MKKLARLVSLLLAGVMVMALLAGCNGSFRSNTQAEDAILKYFQENYGERLTNDVVLRQKASLLLAKATDDGRISLKDYQEGTTTYYDSIIRLDVTTACPVFDAEPDEDGYLQMREFTGDVEEFLGGMLPPRQMLLSVGVATRVIDGKTYVAFAFTLVRSNSPYNN